MYLKTNILSWKVIAVKIFNWKKWLSARGSSFNTRVGGFRIPSQCPDPVQMFGSGPNVRIRSKCPDPVQMSGSGPNVRIRSKCPDPVQMSGSGPNLRIRSKCPDPVQMSGSGPNVRIRSNCPDPVKKENRIINTAIPCVDFCLNTDFATKKKLL
jgi:hypothetical protein